MSNFSFVIGQKLGITLENQVTRPYLFLGPHEDSSYKDYWVLSLPGRKTDYTTKRYPIENIQQIIDQTKLKWVQVGEAHHDHHPIKNTANLLGKTSLRDLIVLIANCKGVLSGDSLAWHIAAAFSKPAVCIASGFAPVHWIAYQTGRVLSKHGALPCCKERACWRGKVDKDCQQPIKTQLELIPKCMTMIQPEEVIKAIMDFSS